MEKTKIKTMKPAVKESQDFLPVDSAELLLCYCQQLAGGHRLLLKEPALCVG